MKLFIYCGGGLGREIYDICIRSNLTSPQYQEINFIDDESPKRGSSFISGIPAFHGTKLNRILKDKDQFLIANGEPEVRKQLYKKLLKHKNNNFAKVSCPSSVISPSALMKKGTIIGPQCSVQSNAIIGINVFLNTQSVIGHDAEIKSHAVISSKVNIGGNVVIGSCSYVGMGAQIKEGISIGSNTIIGMGSVVYNDIPDNMIAIGNPARPIKKNLSKRVFKK